MLTLKQLYKKVIKDENLKESFFMAYKEKYLNLFLKIHDCNAKEQEANEFIEKLINSKAIDKEKLEQGVEQCYFTFPKNTISYKIQNLEYRCYCEKCKKNTFWSKYNAPFVIICKRCMITTMDIAKYKENCIIE
mgnify:FL=1